MSVTPTADNTVMNRTQSFEIDKVKTANNENTAVDKKSEVSEVITVPKDIVSSNLSMKQFSIALIKNITGAGVLCIPYAIKNMGIIGTLFFFSIFCVANIWFSRLLVNVTDYTYKTPSKYPSKEIGNDYAVIMYHILGPLGYYTFVFLYVIAIWGCQIGTLITIVDFFCRFPWPETLFTSASSKRIILHCISTVIELFLLLLKDLSPIVGVASLSIFALVISFTILLVYGLVHYGIGFDSSLWKPVSIITLCSAMGIPSFSLGYNFSYLSFYKQLNGRDKKNAQKTTAFSIGGTTILIVLLTLIALLSYGNKEGGIQQNILLMIPEHEISAIIVNIMMFLSCLFTYPIYSPPLNEVLEESIKNKQSWSVFVSDYKRVLYRTGQTLLISVIAFVFPVFGDIVSLDIL